MSNFRFIILFFVLTHCSDGKNSVEIRLLNEELYYSPMFNLPKGEIKQYSIDSTLDYSIEAKSEMKSYTNTITYEIKNNSDDKIVLFNNKLIHNRVNNKDLEKDILFGSNYQIKDSTGRDLDFRIFFKDNLRDTLSEVRNINYEDKFENNSKF